MSDRSVLPVLTNDYPLRILSLFSGIGGFECGIKRVFPNSICVGYSEVDDDAIQVYQRHFPDHPLLGPVQEVKGNLDVDLIVAGSPCKDLSQLRANNEQKGLDGEQSGLFYEFLRILKENQPCYFILENVASMPESEKNKISKALGVEPVMLDSRFVSAQRRKRLFWTNFPVEEFNEEHLKKAPKLKDILVDEKDALDDWVDLDGDKNVANYYRRQQEGKRVSGYYMVSESDAPKSKTLTTIYRTWVLDKRARVGKMRKLHPREGERLQTFPPHWVDGLSHKSQMKVLGNAVTCDVITYIMQHLSRFLERK